MVEIEFKRFIQKLKGGKDQDALRVDPEERPGLYTDNFLQRSLARLFSYSGRQWEPSVGDINEVPFTNESGIGSILAAGPKVLVINAKYKGVAKDVFVWLDNKAGYGRIMQDQIHVGIIRKNFGVSNYFSPQAIHEAGGETDLLKNVVYDEVNDFYVVKLKGITAFDYSFTIEIENTTGATLKYAAGANLLKIRDQLEDLEYRE